MSVDDSLPSICGVHPAFAEVPHYCSRAVEPEVTNRDVNHLISEDAKKARNAARHRSMLVRRALRMIALYDGPHFQNKKTRKQAMRLVRCGNHAQTFLHDPEDVRFEHLYLQMQRKVFQ